MKYLKISIAAFAATFIFSIIGVNAEYAYHGYVSVTLPAFKKEVMKGPQTKTQNGLQYYENTGTINQCASNENGVDVAVKSESGGKSNWLTITGKDQSGAWANTKVTTVKRAYNIIMKNHTTSACSAKHSGTWFLDKGAYDLTH